MKRNVVKIHEDKCVGCGLCVNTCHEGALELRDGKAVLVSDVYCDGLGNCLPKCPVNAIEIIEREAEEYNKELVDKRKQEKEKEAPCGCPGQQTKVIINKGNNKGNGKSNPVAEKVELTSQLRQWPVQLNLVNPNAPFFQDSHILVAADCTAFAYANIHDDFMKNKVTLIGCPKLDNTDYSEKLAAILKNNNVKSITVLRMDVPCCGGLLSAVKNAIIQSGELIPWDYKVISTDGVLLEN